MSSSSQLVLNMGINIKFRKPKLVSELTWRVLGIYMFVSVGPLHFLFFLCDLGCRANIRNCLVWILCGFSYQWAFCAFPLTVSQNYGFDIAWWSSCLGLQQFADDFGVQQHPGEAKVIPSSWQSAGTGTPNAGMALGCILGGYCSAYLGRKITIVVLSIISIIGVIIQTAVPVS